MDPELDDVYLFAGNDAEGQPWSTYFDTKTRKVKRAESGSAQMGTTRVVYTPESWTARHSFDNSEFPVCLSNKVQFEDAQIMPSGEFGFLMF